MNGARNHPGSLAAQLLASAALILVSGGYALWQPGPKAAARPVLRTMAMVPVKKPATVAAVPVPAVPASTMTAQLDKPHPSAIKKTAVKPAALKPSEPAYADGDFTGEPFDSDYGPLQVQVSIQGGRIVSLNFLQVPDHRERSAEISAEVIPVLTQEAIQAQSSRIDIVASATYTTIVFADALYNALEKAKK